MTLNQTSWQPGQANPNATMSDAEARAARWLRYEFDMTVQELATMYRTGRTAMSLLLRGKTYADAGGPIDPGRKSPSKTPGPRSRAYRLGERKSQEKGSE